MREKFIAATKEFGTPLYVYDLNAIRANLHDIQSAFGSRTQIHYACKALANRQILRQLRDWGCGIDAVSQEELMIAL